MSGFAADIPALVCSAAVSENVRAGPRGVVIAAIVMEVPLLAFGENLSWLGARMKRATSEESEGDNAVLSRRRHPRGSVPMLVRQGTCVR